VLVWKTSLLALLSLTLLIACSNSVAPSPAYGTPQQSNTPTPTPPSPSSGLLPGQAIWKNGVSSYLFGTNDSVDYSDDNFVTDPSNPTDPFTMNHIYTDPATGKVETDLDFAEKVVAYLGNRCNLYEIGNEPDLDVYPASGSVVPHLRVQTYLNRWTEFVKALRQINPKAKFIGPVTASDLGNDCTYTTQGTSCYMRNFLKGAKAAGVLPDAVSFHWYPCDSA